VIVGVLGTHISGDDFVGIVIAVLITAYLFFALIKPEKL
jgi:K+-transporting ATPase KdpF subunit